MVSARIGEIPEDVAWEADGAVFATDAAAAAAPLPDAPGDFAWNPPSDANALVLLADATDTGLIPRPDDGSPLTLSDDGDAIDAPLLGASQSAIASAANINQGRVDNTSPAGVTNSTGSIGSVTTQNPGGVAAEGPGAGSAHAAAPANTPIAAATFSSSGPLTFVTPSPQASSAVVPGRTIDAAALVHEPIAAGASDSHLTIDISYDFERQHGPQCGRAEVRG